MPLLPLLRRRLRSAILAIVAGGRANIERASSSLLRETTRPNSVTGKEEGDRASACARTGTPGTNGMQPRCVQPAQPCNRATERTNRHSLWRVWLQGRVQLKKNKNEKEFHNIRALSNGAL